MKPISGKRLLSICLWALALLALLNLLLSASLVALVCGLVLWVMIWGIRRGDYPLARGLGIFLYLYGAVNLAVLAAVCFSDTAARISSMLWLGGYSLSLLVLGRLLRGRKIRDYLRTAKPPEEPKKRIHFFHGGWRDL